MVPFLLTALANIFIFFLHNLPKLFDFYIYLTRLKQQNSHLTQIKINKMLSLMRNIRTEISADDTVPCGVVFLVEFFLDISGDIFFYVVLFHRLGGDVDGVLLHVLGHVGIFDDGFAGVGHYYLVFNDRFRAEI